MVSVRGNTLSSTFPAGAPPDSWGTGLRDLSQQGLKKGVDELKKGTWKVSDPSKNDSSTSLGNVGNESCPSTSTIWTHGIKAPRSTNSKATQLESVR
jgi:hypothetical protein